MAFRVRTEAGTSYGYQRWYVSDGGTDALRYSMDDGVTFLGVGSTKSIVITACSIMESSGFNNFLQDQVIVEIDSLIAAPGESITWSWGNEGTEVAFILIENNAASQNYPNPFNPKTSVSFSVPRSGHVRLVVYDMLGREIAILIDDVVSAGRQNILFDGQHLSSGLYIYRLETEGHIHSRKMILLR